MNRKIIAAVCIVGTMGIGALAFAEGGEILNTMETVTFAVSCGDGTLDWGLVGQHALISKTDDSQYCSNDSVGTSVDWQFKGEDMTGPGGTMALETHTDYPVLNAYTLGLTPDADATGRTMSEMLILSKTLQPPVGTMPPFAPGEILSFDQRLITATSITIGGEFSGKIYISATKSAL
jgi:hypothetical protein